MSDWTPTPDNINALPDPVRKYIHDIETICDPAGIVAENTLLKDQTRQLDAMIARLRVEIERLQSECRKAREALLGHAGGVVALKCLERALSAGGAE